MADKKTVFEYVKTYIFQEIFNDSDITLKNNIRLTILNNGKSVRGTLYNNVVVTQLPTSTVPYYLYMCSSVHISNMLGGERDWVNLADVLSGKHVNADIITEDNLMIPKRLAYGKVLRQGKTLIAIDANTIKKYQAKYTTPYLVINEDTDNINNRYVVSHIPGVEENFPALLGTFVNNDPNIVLAFVNGYNYSKDVFTNVANPSVDDVEVYVDENALFSFEVDLAIRNTYLSSTEELYKDIVLIPRNLSGDKLLTFDTITVIVRDINGKGVMLPFVADKSVSQLTHNSISISSYLIDAALDKLGVTTGSLYIQVCDYSKDNFLTRNGMLTNLMYDRDDEFVMNALLNKLTPSIPYWSADKLESSVYSNYLTEMGELASYSPDLIDKQIACLGFYNFCNLVCQHNGEITPTANSQLSNISIPLPLFWDEEDMYVLLYLDGFKIKSSRYEVSKSNTNLDIHFDTPLVLGNSPLIAYEFIRNITPMNISFTPDINNRILEIPKGDPIYVFADTISNDVEGVSGIVSDLYMPLALSNTTYYNLTETNEAYTFLFSEIAYNSKFTIARGRCTWFEEHHNVDINDGKTIAFIPKTRVVDKPDEYSTILTDDVYEVYLNGRFLVPEIDYCKVSLNNQDNTIKGGYQIVVQNLKFLKDDGSNEIEIVKTDQTIDKLDTGYIVDGIIALNENNEAWIPGLSRLFVNGKLVPNSKVTRNDTHYSLDNTVWNNGDVYCFIMGISTDFKSTYVSHDNNRYYQNRLDIINYMSNGWSRTLPDPIIIPYVNKIYSSYLNEIIRRILSGEIHVDYVNNDEDIILQLADYDYLKEFDTIFKSAINKDYVDLYPSYLSSVETNDQNHYLFINRLVKIILGNDQYHDTSVVYTR